MKARMHTLTKFNLFKVSFRFHLKSETQNNFRPPSHVDSSKVIILRKRNLKSGKETGKTSGDKEKHSVQFNQKYVNQGTHILTLQIFCIDSLL